VCTMERCLNWSRGPDLLTVNQLVPLKTEMCWRHHGTYEWPLGGARNFPMGSFVSLRAAWAGGNRWQGGRLLRTDGQARQ